MDTGSRTDEARATAKHRPRIHIRQSQSLSRQCLHCRHMTWQVDCKHLKGTWRREGNHTIIECENKDYRLTFNVDTPAAYQLVEHESEQVFIHKDGTEHRYP